MVLKGRCLLDTYTHTHTHTREYLRMKLDDSHKNGSVRGNGWEMNAIGLARRVNCFFCFVLF